MHDRLTDAEFMAASSIQDAAFREAESAHDRINRGLTTVEEECARLGRSWQQVLAQQAAERKAMQDLGLGPHPFDPAG